MPWLYYLGLTNNCRIFQNKSPLEIFKEICRSYGYLSIDTGMLTKRYDPIAYCTQYNESDADFIDRLFQKYGISYVFTHEAGQHTMFLFDYIGACPSCDENVIFNHKLKATQALHEWKQNNRWSTNRYTLADYDPTQASLSLSATNQSKQGLEVLTASKYEHFEYPGRFDTNAAGSIQAQQKTDSHAYLTQFVEAASNNLSLKPGSPFTLIQHPDVDPQGKYFITTLKHQARDYTGLPFAHDQPSEQHYVNDLTCFSTKLAYAPLTIVPWPEIMGPQTAVVVGTEEESAYPDKYARVKVQFNWDRQGEYTSACSRWIRVGQGYGGGTHGMQALPRKGSIVLVDFVEGDPDRPQIAGMLPGPNDTLPFSPEERPNTSGIKTRTPGGQAGAYNEFSFDDSPGRQNINIQAQNSMNISAKGDARSTVTGDMTHNIEGDHTHSAHDSIIYSAKDKMTLKVGDTKIEMEPRKMTITTFRFATGMPPEPTDPLPEKVPTFTSAQGSEQTADTQTPQKQQSADSLFYPSAKLSIDLGQVALPPRKYLGITCEIRLSMNAEL